MKSLCKFRSHLFCFGLFSLLLISTNSSAQTVQFNAQGEKILVFGDGTWRHYMPGDSVYMAKTEISDSFVVQEQNDIDPFENPVESKEEKAKSNKQRAPKKKGINNPEDNYILARQFRIEAEEKFRKLQKNREKNDKEVIDAAEDKVALKIQEENEAKEAYEHFKKTGKTQIDPFENQINAKEPSAMQGLEDGPENKPEVDSQKSNKKGNSNKGNGNTEGLFPPNTILEKAAIYPCGINKQSDGNTSSRQTNAAVFFKYTDETLKSFLGNKDFIVCESSILEKNGNIFLVLNYHLYTKSARQEYGHIQEGAMLILSLLQGQNINLFNTEPGSALYDEKNGLTHYQGIYAISREQIKILAQADIKATRVVWSSGYEDYEVYNMDLIRSQLACLIQNQ